MKKIGLIGCGAIGRRHAKNLRHRAHLVFCSRTRASAERFHEEFGGQVCDDFEALLALPDLDAVVICTPPEAHREQTIAALQANLPVLVEKPLCPSPEDLDAIQAAATASDAFVMVAENYYYKPSLARIKQWLPAIGPLQEVEIGKCFTQKATGWKSRYGALLEGGIHFVALLADLFDAPPDRVEAAFPGYTPGTPERHSVLNLHFGPTTARLRYAWDQPSLPGGLLQRSRLIGTHDRIHFESNGLWMRRGPRLLFPLGDMMGYDRMTDDFLACLEDPARRPYSDLARARRDLEIVFAAYEQLPH